MPKIPEKKYIFLKRHFSDFYKESKGQPKHQTGHEFF
jgi:hypothetical protein